MSYIQDIFTNREIAIGFWLMFTIVIAMFTKPGQEFVKSTLPIIFCRKFVIFYFVFLSCFSLIVYFLSWSGFWDINLLKDTIFWVIFVELPLFVQTIEKAKDSHFFKKLISENIALIVIIEFLLNFWTFGLITELILVPCTVLIAFLYAIAANKKEHQKIKHFFDGLFAIFGIVIVSYAIRNILKTPEQIFNIYTLKEFLLPTFLLFLNLPVVYGLALYNTYEQLFIWLRGDDNEKAKMKRRLFLFAGINLTKVTSIRDNMNQTLIISLTENDLKDNLKLFENRISMQIGENYMKRPYFYITSCIIGLVLSIIGLILNNSQVSVKDIITLNFIMDIARFKEIITYICSTGFVFSICLLFFSIGLGKKKNEEISQVKKNALYELIHLVKRQYSMLKEYPPLDNPIEFFSLYVTTAGDIKAVCDKSVDAYENLLKKWEHDSIKQLQIYVTTFLNDLGVDAVEVDQYDVNSFSVYFTEKTAAAPQNDSINAFTYTIEKDIEKYTEQIKLCYDEFKRYL